MQGSVGEKSVGKNDRHFATHQRDGRPAIPYLIVVDMLPGSKRKDSLLDAKHNGRQSSR